MHFKGGLAEAADPFLGNLHGLNRTDRHTQAAAAALFSIKNYCHFRTLERQGSCGADPGAGAALETALVIAMN